MTTTVLVRLVVNDESQTHPAGTTVADLVAAQVAAGKRVAVERNGTIVPRSERATTLLEDGDRLEVVVAVGGG